MSTDTVKLRVRVGANEVEVEAPLHAMKEALDLVFDTVKRIQGEGVFLSPRSVDLEAREEQTLPHTLTRAMDTELPEIRVEKDDSLSDVIAKMFRQPWGKQPRKLNQVREVLESYGMIYPKQSVAVALLRLAQSGRLRRFKDEDGEFVYTASSLLSAEANLAEATGKD